MVGLAWVRVLHLSAALASHPGHARGAVGPARRVWRRRLARCVVRRRAAREPSCPAEVRKWGAMRLRRARSHLARGLGRGYGGSRGCWRYATRVKGALRAPKRVGGHPTGARASFVKLKVASSSEISCEARQMCRVARIGVGNLAYFGRLNRAAEIPRLRILSHSDPGRSMSIATATSHRNRRMATSLASTGARGAGAVVATVRRRPACRGHGRMTIRCTRGACGRTCVRDGKCSQVGVPLGTPLSRGAWHLRIPVTQTKHTNSGI
jgi:hypothetical protein